MMTDQFSISYSYQPPAPAAGGGPSVSPAGDAGLYAAADCERVDTSGDGVLLLDRQGDNQLAVTREVAAALSACQCFQTLDEHVHTLTSTIPQLEGHGEDVKGVLQTLRDAGMLQPASATLERLYPAHRPPPPCVAASAVAIITCDRPDALERLLDSIREGADLTRHEQFLLVDDSRDSGCAQRNAAAARQFSRRTGRAMVYLGRTAQRALLDKLLGALPGHERGIRFLLDSRRWSGRPTYGLARTVAILFSVGQRLVVLDDDVLCSVVASPHTTAGMRLGGQPRRVDVYASREAMAAETRRLGFDPLAGHCELLGTNLAAVIDAGAMITPPGSAPAPELLRGANAAALAQWSSASPVLVTQSGSLGDPGTVGVDWLYTVDPDSARRVIASDGGLEAALANRHYWMGQPCLTLSRMPIISQVTGLDNSRLLPPYFPVFRGEDYLFGAMVEFLHPQAVSLEYPWSVPHLPMPSREGRGGPPAALARFSLNPAKYVTDRTRYVAGISPETRLRHLALLAAELAQMSDRSLTTLYRREYVEAQTACLQRLQSVMADGLERPPAWQTHLEQAAAAAAASLQALADPADQLSLAGAPDTSALLAQFRDYAQELALALDAWSDVRRVAGDFAPGIIESVQSDA